MPSAGSIRSAAPAVTGYTPGRLGIHALRLARLARVAGHLLRGVWIAGLVFPRASAARRTEHIRSWSRELLRMLGVRLQVRGEPPRGRERPVLMVANHVSWLDIFLIDAVSPVRFVAKSEVGTWPLISRLSQAAGTLYLHRARRSDAARINHLVAAALRGGASFAIFPEGTTSDGSRVLPFHSALFEPAVTVNTAVQPVAIRYLRADGTRCAEAAYHDGKSIWNTLWALTGQAGVCAQLVYLDPIPAGHRRRRDLAASAREAIIQDLSRGSPRSRSDRGFGPPA